MANRKIVCLGGGGMYFKAIIKNFPVAPALAGSEIVIYDINEERARRMASVGQRLSDEAGAGITFRSTLDVADAVDGADFAVASIGGAGSDASTSVSGSYFHQADLYIPAKYGIHQLIGDTGGPAGMMMGFRSVHAYLQTFREMEKRCPNVIAFNHSNPMSVICRAMLKYTGIKTYGICHGVQGGRAFAAGLLDLPSAELDCVWVGTNHYYWFTRVVHKGRDVYPELRRRMAECEPEKNRALARTLSGIYGHQIVYQSDDHLYEFYSFASSVSGQADLPDNLVESARRHGYDENTPMPEGPNTSPQAMAAFYEFFQKELDDVVLPAELNRDPDGEGVVPMIDDIISGRRNVYIVNTANNYSIPNLPPEALVEVEAVTDSSGLRVLQMDEAPTVLKGMLEKRFAWQELVADAAVSGDRDLAMQALTLDEMAIWPDRARAMLEELLEASKPLVPQFFSPGAR
jgi:alpha-galactosidase